ncbi:hypothetical protein ACFVX6_36990 [Streptomyces sp. NPDC058289]|uniref:hypothetical protein n=1 Tax=Streptomyces sp. NPDC058289 TaxID=3346425 RepID=UPI0036E98DBC
MAVSEDARRSWGPLTEGLKVPLDMNLGDRAKVLEQLGVEPAAHAAMVSMVRDVLPEHEAGLLIGARHWPLLAARMQQLGDSQGQKVLGAHLARLGTDTSWKQSPASALVGRPVEQTHHALTTPPPARVSRVRVSPGAARSRSTTTSNGAAPGQAAPTEAAVPAHRQAAARVKGTGRARHRSQIRERCRPGCSIDPIQGNRAGHRRGTGGVMMSGRQRRVVYGTLAGVLLQSCAGWVLWSGYTDAGLVLSLMAGAVVLNSLWCLGILDRTRAMSMAGGWWYPVGVALLATAVSVRLHRSVKKLLVRLDGGVHPFGYREVFGVMLPFPAGIPLLYMPGLYGWLVGTPVALGGVGTAVAWGLVIAGGAGVLAASTRLD